MLRSLAHPDLISIFSQQLSMSGSTPLLRAMFNSPPAPIPGAPILPWVLLELLQSVSFPCNIRGQHPGAGSGFVQGKWQRRRGFSSTGFSTSGRCQSLQSSCCHSPAPLGTAGSKVHGWGCCRTVMRNIWIRDQWVSHLQGNPNLILPKKASQMFSLSSSSPTPSHPSSHSWFLSFSFLLPALISLPSQVSPSGCWLLLPHTASAREASRPPQNLGHRTWHLHPDPPKVGVCGSLGTQPRYESSFSLPAMAFYILCSWLASQETKFHTRISRMVLTRPGGGYSFNPARHLPTHWESQMQRTGPPEPLLQCTPSLPPPPTPHCSMEQGVL